MGSASILRALHTGAEKSTITATTAELEIRAGLADRQFDGQTYSGKGRERARAPE